MFEQQWNISLNHELNRQHLHELQREADQEALVRSLGRAKQPALLLRWLRNALTVLQWRGPIQQPSVDQSSPHVMVLNQAK